MLIFYKSGYKYQLHQPITMTIPITGFSIKHEYFSLSTKGLLTINKGYAWDGATGFPDLKTIIRGSLVHDCLYQMIRLRLLPTSKRDDADLILKNMCIEDGMASTLAWAVYKGVRIFGSNAAKSSDKPILSAP